MSMANSSEKTKLLLPGDPEFAKTLGRTLPPDWQRVAEKHSGNYAFIVRPGDGGTMTAVSQDEATDYLYSGEYDERLEEDEDELTEEQCHRALMQLVCGTI